MKYMRLCVCKNIIMQFGEGLHMLLTKSLKGSLFFWTQCIQQSLNNETELDSVFDSGCALS